MKYRTIFILSLLIAALLAACGQNSQDANVAVMVATALTQTAAAPKPTAPPAATATTAGVISGKVELMAPPTPHMVVYAVDPTSKKWVFTETTANDSGPSAFTLVVPEGAYQLFAFSDNGAYTAYSLDGQALSFVSVAANQTVADIVLQSPGQGDCGSMFGVPASPEGRFKAVPGPAADCLAKLKTPEASSNTQSDDSSAVRIQFQPNTTSWETTGDLPPHGNILFVLNAQKGQTMTVDLTTEPVSGSAMSGTLFIKGADGQVFTPDSTLSWSNVLPASQDYYVGVASMVGQTINYTLSVDIPAASAAAAPGSYVPVTVEICKIIQEAASDALSTPFTMKSSATFTDPVSQEKGRGCILTAYGTGAQFSDPGKVVADLVKGIPGWDEKIAYQAGGPKGAATGMTRDAALMLISAEWTHAPGTNCPADKPISVCDLKPEQRLYTIKIQTAMK